MRVSPWPEAVAKPEEIDFVDGAQRLSDRTLDDLILQRRNTEGALPAIGLGNVDAPYRLRSVAPGVDARAEGPEVALQVLLVHRHRDPVDPCACLPFLPAERSFERADIDMMRYRAGQTSTPGRLTDAHPKLHPNFHHLDGVRSEKLTMTDE